MSLPPRPPLCAALLLAILAGAAQAEPPMMVQQWKFNEPGQMLGWVAGGHIKSARVEDGALRGTAVDWDPILMGPVFEIRATPSQFVEVRIRCERTGNAELFWTETLDGKFGGFSQQKYASFSVVGDKEFRNYRVYPFWHSKGKIVRLRLDVPPDGEFAIEAIRILDAGTSPTTETAWQGKAALGQWEAMQQTGAVDVSMGRLQFQAEGNRPILLSPLLDVEGKKNPIVAVRMAVSAGSLGRIYAVNRNQVGWEDLTFPLRPDGRMHTYNIDMGGIRHWDGKVLCVAVQPTDTPEAKVAIESIEIADDLRGPAELEIDYFGRAEGVNRVGRPARVICTVRNAGGALAEGATARLEVPQGVTVVGSSQQTFSPISLYLPKSVEWQIQADRPGAMPLTVCVEMAGHKTITSESTIEFTPVPQVAHAGYVPEPQPVRSKIDVGAFYFPRLEQHVTLGADSRLPHAAPRLGLVRRGEPRVRRLADQVGRGARHQLLHGRLVLEPGQSPPGALAPRRLRQRQIQKGFEVGDHVGQPQSGRHALAGGLAAGNAVLARPLPEDRRILPHRRAACRVHLGTPEHPQRPGRKRQGEGAL